MRIFEPRILEPNSGVEIFSPMFSNKKSPLENSPSRNSPPKIHIKNSHQNCDPGRHLQEPKNAKKHSKSTLWGTPRQVPKIAQKALRGALSGPGLKSTPVNGSRDRKPRARAEKFTLHFCRAILLNIFFKKKFGTLMGKKRTMTMTKIPSRSLPAHMVMVL